MANQQDFYLQVKRVFTESDILEKQYVRITNGLIHSITTQPESGVEVITSDYAMAPGYLDLHIHGREGCDVMDASRESLQTIADSLAKYGVVGFLATTVTADWPSTLQAYRAIGEAYQQPLSGAQLLGAYNEGLFFTADHKGAHDDDYFLPLTQENLDALITAAQGSLKVVALAPELDNAQFCIEYLNKHGIKTMLGHTNADFDCTNSALQHGACGGVHVFNGMRGIHHRDPGCAGAVLLDQNAYVEVIADGVHLHPAILDMICRLKTVDKIGLISDCIVAGGLADGRYRLGMLDVNVNQGIAKTDSGSLAGSTLTLDKAVQNMINLANVPAQDAINMASLAPAKMLGIDNQLGKIAPGYQASFNLLDDNYNVVATYIHGQKV